MTENSIKIRLSIKITLLAVFSILTFFAALLNKFTMQGGQVVFSIIYSTGSLVLGFFGGATLIALIAGMIYMFQSTLGFFSLASFAVRGVSTDVMFLILRVYNDARHRRYNWVKIAIALVVASFVTGLFQYFFFVIFMKMLIDFGRFIVSLIFIVALVSNAIGGFITGKFIMPSIDRYLKGR
jgi:hypothetical protein